MNKVISFFVITMLFLTLNLSVLAQKRVGTQIAKNDKNVTTEFASTEAFSDGNGVWFKWQMKVEFNNLGFNVYRVKGGTRELVNENFIGGTFLQNNEETILNGTYTFFDPKGSLDSIYVVETLSLNGQKSTSNLISVNYTNDLVEVAGLTSDQLVNISKNEEYKIERNELLLSKELQLEISENSLLPDLNRQRLIAAQPGVKLGVKKQGIYRVSRTELANSGFNVNAPVENWQLYKNGNEQAIIIGTNGDYIEFYGEGIDTVESGTQIYYLINGTETGKRINPITRRPIGGNVVSTSYDQSFYKSDRLQYITQIRNGDASNFFAQVITTTNGDVNFNLDGIDRSFTGAVLTVRVQGLTLTPHNVNVVFNGVSLQPLSGNNYDSMTRTYQIPTSMLIEGNNTVSFRTPSNPSDINLVESIKVDYPRNYLAKQNTLAFYAKSNKKSEVKGFSSPNLRVFDTTYPDSPTVISNLQITQENGSFGVSIPANRPRTMFAVADSAVLPIDSIEQHTPSTLATANHNASLVIITHKNWLNEAEAWANYRRNDGFSVEVVRVDDIFDEFNYGITSANSIKSFLQFAKNNWQTPPNYVLIIGDASYDPRGFTGAANSNFVPTKFFDTYYEETGSDEALADFDDDGLSEMAIGRIPTQNGAFVTQLLGKVTIFEQSAGQAFSRGALFASDEPNGYDFAGMNQRLANELPAGTPKVMVNRTSPSGRADLLNELNNGRYLVNYSGHGAPSLWAATSFYSSADVPSMSNGTNYSIFTMLTCLNGYFITPFSDSIAELMLKAPNGGAVAAWASSGKTTPDVQEVLARRFYQKISQGNILRMGDLIKDAKQNVNGGRDVRLSWTLLGDPTLKVH
jgi:hypothetical protein